MNCISDGFEIYGAVLIHQTHHKQLPIPYRFHAINPLNKYNNSPQLPVADFKWPLDNHKFVTVAFHTTYLDLKLTLNACTVLQSVPSLLMIKEKKEKNCVLPNNSHTFHKNTI